MLTFQVIASSTEPDQPDSDFYFDPYEGFKIKIVDSWEMKGQHECEATWPKSSVKIRSTQFKIKIQGMRLYWPSIISYIFNSLFLKSRSGSDSIG